MFNFKDSEEKCNFKSYNLSLKQFCDKLNVGPNRFYAKLREIGIFYGDVNEPRKEYEKYFVANDSSYNEISGKESYYITAEGEEFIRNLFTEEELKAMAKSKYAKVRSQKNYKYY